MRALRLILSLFIVQLFFASSLLAGSISGRVTYDGSGQPVAGAQVLIGPPSQQGSFLSLITNSDGYYGSNEVPAGDYIVSCTKIDWANKTIYTEYYDNVQTKEEATVIHVTADSKISNINFGIPDGGTPPADLKVIVKGTVKDVDGDAVQGAIVKVWLGRFTDHLLWFSKNKLLNFITATTDASGNYEIKFDKTADMINWIVVSAEKDGYLTEFYNNKAYFYQANPVQITKAGTIENINFSLTPVGTPSSNSISGKVTCNCGDNLKGAFVIATGSHVGEVYTAVTDENGHYSLSNLKAGKYYLLFAAHGYVPEFYNNAYRWEDADVIEVNGTVNGINAELKEMPVKPGNCIVKGIIKAASDGFISGVLITIKNHLGEAVSSAITGDDGSYQISELAEGTYNVEASKVDYESVSAEVTVNASNSTQVKDLSLKQTATAVGKNGKIIPAEIKLVGNYPNPFNPSTKISFTLPSQEFTTLRIYNMLGQEVATLVNGKLDAGIYNINFNAGQLSSGVYLYELRAGSYSSVMKMVLTK